MRIIELYIFVRNNIVYLALSRPEHYLMTVSRIVHVNLERVHLCTYVSAIFFLRVLFCLLQEKLDILYSECFVIPVFLHTLTLLTFAAHIYFRYILLLMTKPIKENRETGRYKPRKF